MTHGPLGIGGVLELDVGKAARKVAMGAVRWELDTLHRTIASKDLQQVVTSDVARQSAHVNLARPGRRRGSLAPATA